MKTSKRAFIRLLNLALLAFVVSAASLSSASVLADTRTMIIYSDVAGAPEILAEDYEKAIEILANARGQGELKISLLNNLCVAYTLADELELARTSCDQAVVEAAEHKNYGDWFQRYTSGRSMRRYQSRAHANRSILRLKSGDTTGAKQDWRQVRASDK